LQYFASYRYRAWSVNLMWCVQRHRSVLCGNS